MEDGIKPKSIAKVYANINTEKPTEYSDYENYVVTWSRSDHYSLIKRIGRGKYSDVFLGFNDDIQKEVVVKVLKPVRKRKIRREIKILECVKGHKNIVRLLDVVKNEIGVPSLIFEYVNCIEYNKFVQLVTLDDIRCYMFQLLEALNFCHSVGIIHRDVKPQNMIIDHNNRILKLIDWGLAEFYHPGMAYNVRVASRYYKSPELLVDFQEYDYSLDIWSFGCVLAGLVLKRDPFFQGSDNKDQLVKIVKVIGSLALTKYLLKYHIKLDFEYTRLLDSHRNVPFITFVDNNNSHLATSCAIDLISKCLVFDHQERLTAEEAMSHHFFRGPVSKKASCECSVTNSKLKTLNGST